MEIKWIVLLMLGLLVPILLILISLIEKVVDKDFQIWIKPLYPLLGLYTAGILALVTKLV